MTTESAPAAPQIDQQVTSPSKKPIESVSAPAAPAPAPVDTNETAAVAAEADKAPAATTSEEQPQQDQQQPDEEMDGGIDADTLEISAEDIKLVPALEDEGRRALTLNQYEEAIEKLGKAATIV